MRKSFLVIELILLTRLSAAAVPGQQPPNPNNGVPSPAVARVQQILALLDSQDPNAPTMLRKALADENWYVRGEAARALGRLGDKSAGSVLLPLLQDQHWFVRSAALEAIASLRASSDDPTLRDLATSTSADPYVRARAITTTAAGNIASAESLLQALADGDEIVRRAAATALGEMRATKAVDALLSRLKDDDPGVRKAAAKALGRIGDTRATAALLASLPEPGPDQWEYAAALYRLGNRERLDQITPALRSEYADVRRGALKALLEFADNRALPALVALIDGSADQREELYIRIALAEGLAAFEGDEARTVLVKMLDDGKPAVRAAAVASIAKASLPDPASESSRRSIVALIGALKKENSPIVIEEITRALASVDRTRIVDLLLDARDADGKLSPTILKALAAAGVTTENQSL